MEVIKIKKNKRIKLFISLLGILILIILLWKGFVTNEPEPLKIGFAGGLTGVTSELGVSGRNGLNMAVDKVNNNGGIHGRPIELVIKDDENNPKRALEINKEFYEEEVFFIIGHMTSNMGAEVIPFINENKTLMISPTMSADNLSEIDDYFLRVVSSNKYEGEFMAEIYNKDVSIENVLIIKDDANKEYSDILSYFFIKEFIIDENKSVSFIDFNSNETIDYNEVAKKALDKEPDAIILIASSFDSAMFCQVFQREDISVPKLLSVWSKTEDLIINGGSAVEGVNIVSLKNSFSTKIEYENFYNDYVRRYSKPPSFSSVFAYDAGMVLFNAFLELEPDEITPYNTKNKILEMKFFEGLENNIVIDEYGDSKREIYHFKVENGEFVRANP